MATKFFHNRVIKIYDLRNSKRLKIFQNIVFLKMNSLKLKLNSVLLIAHSLSEEKPRQ